MKDKRFIIMISTIISILMLLFMIFMVATIFSFTLNKATQESLRSSIALFAVFATFGGALVGTLLAGYISRNQLLEIFEKEKNKENFRSFYSENESLLYQMYNENIDKIHGDLASLILNYNKTKKLNEENHKKLIGILEDYINFLSRKESGDLLYNTTLEAIKFKVFKLIDKYDVTKEYDYLNEKLKFNKLPDCSDEDIITEIENIVELYEKLPVTNINNLKLEKLMDIEEYIK